MNRFPSDGIKYILGLIGEVNIQQKIPPPPNKTSLYIHFIGASNAFGNFLLHTLIIIRTLWKTVELFKSKLILSFWLCYFYKSSEKLSK